MLLIKEQSQSVVRGEHPIAFVLPTVSARERLSSLKCHSCFSIQDLDVGAVQRVLRPGEPPRAAGLLLRQPGNIQHDKPEEVRAYGILAN